MEKVRIKITWYEDIKEFNFMAKTFAAPFAVYYCIHWQLQISI